MTTFVWYFKATPARYWYTPEGARPVIDAVGCVRFCRPDEYLAVIHPGGKLDGCIIGYFSTLEKAKAAVEAVAPMYMEM